MRAPVIVVLSLASISLCACDLTRPAYESAGAPAAAGSMYDIYGSADPSKINFLDTVTPQAAPAIALSSLELATPKGESVVLSDYLKSRNLVVVITRGYAGAICPYCSSQTSRLIANYNDIKSRGAEVVVIYPLEAEKDRPRTDEFLAVVNGQISKAASDQPPFPLLIDVGLKAVDLLGIRKDLSKPATYILDQTGAIRFAYVGETLADRPSIKAILQQLDALGPPPAEAGSETPKGPNPAVTDPPVADPAAADKG